MPDPRMDALMRALSGGDDEASGGPDNMQEEGAEDPMAQAVEQAMELLQPFMEDPRIAKAAELLQEAGGGPGEMSQDSAITPDKTTDQGMPLSQ